MKVYNEEDYLMLSGIQHFAFCPRQWALIHIENQWEENVRTVEGNIMHKRAHDGPQIETRKNLVVSRQMKVYSRYLGISGICDVVEFKKCKKGEEGVHLYEREGLYKVHPVEYKKGELWKHSYYVETIGSVSEENIRRYIEHQSKSY